MVSWSLFIHFLRGHNSTSVLLIYFFSLQAAQGIFPVLFQFFIHHSFKWLCSFWENSIMLINGNQSSARSCHRELGFMHKVLLLKWKEMSQSFYSDFFTILKTYLRCSHFSVHHLALLCKLSGCNLFTSQNNLVATYYWSHGTLYPMPPDEHCTNINVTLKKQNKLWLLNIVRFYVATNNIHVQQCSCAAHKQRSNKTIRLYWLHSTVGRDSITDFSFGCI